MGDYLRKNQNFIPSRSPSRRSIPLVDQEHTDRGVSLSSFHHDQQPVVGAQFHQSDIKFILDFAE